MPRLRFKPEHPLADKDGWVEINDDYYRYLPDANSNSEKIHVISDNMDLTRHMANGKYYDSKSEFRKATKAAGCIEVGNDASVMNPTPRKPVEMDRRQRRDDIKRAIYEAKNNIRR